MHLAQLNIGRLRAPTAPSEVPRMDVGVALPQMTVGLDRDHILDWCRAIDEGPFSSISAGERITYDNLDGFTLCSAAAAVTERVRILVNAVILPWHSPRSSPRSWPRWTCCPAGASRWPSASACGSRTSPRSACPWRALRTARPGGGRGAPPVVRRRGGRRRRRRPGARSSPVAHPSSAPPPTPSRWPGPRTGPTA